ncbi:dopamine receptor 2-like [Strongylocentrotus purpuratus]|uniref:G-protein coupled receptors family 1 profile domain-containing protein n=1 Tax=Strongylocentrotus purpuratus TaxID=7668 RepID=A0A7M7HLT0_STRPU|nr:dopamine receptor 2-like [Strongylocentrotus purpuratus]|eukprot:XP_011665161.1 PREDICTED: dopamine receptor 2-like [Strongylocentrotus purpuratus]
MFPGQFIARHYEMTTVHGLVTMERDDNRSSHTSHLARSVMSPSGDENTIANTKEWYYESGNSTGNTSELLMDEFRGPLDGQGIPRTIAVGCVLCLCCCLTIFGNTLVIAAVYRERNLRTVTNYFIVSLAFADLLVGSIVVPFAIIDTLTAGYWFFDAIWCDLWHAFDVLGCTASILNLCVISLDRYWAVTHPMSYPTRVTKKMAGLLIVVVWLASAAISFPCILVWRAVEPPHPPRMCIFPQNPWYLVISSCVSFYLPSLIMMFTYYKIYRAAVTQMRHIRSGTKLVCAKAADKSHMNGAVSLRIHRGGGVKSTFNTQHSNNNLHNGLPPEMRPLNVRRDTKIALTQAAGRRLLSRMNKEHKAAKTLGIVVGVFILCWLPFFIINVMAPFCFETCILSPDLVIPLATWLGFINSALNPAIYAFTSRNFKRAFKRILCQCCLKKKKRQYIEGHSVKDSTRFMSIDSVYSMGDIALQ